MTQSFLMYGIGQGPTRQALVAALTSAGFRVLDARRGGPGIQVRIRDNTGDQAEVERIVARHAPDADPMPPGAPMRHIEGYRDGRP